MREPKTFRFTDHGERGVGGLVLKRPVGKELVIANVAWVTLLNFSPPDKFLTVWTPDEDLIKVPPRSYHEFKSGRVYQVEGTEVFFSWFHGYDWRQILVKVQAPRATRVLRAELLERAPIPQRMQGV